jgi:O-antigen ligase
MSDVVEREVMDVIEDSTSESATDRQRRHSRLSTLAVVLLAAIPMIAVAVYGSVDPVALGLQAVLVGLLAVVWIADVAIKGRLDLNLNITPLPLLVLIAIGVVQILPVFGTAVPTDVLKSDIGGTISLDPFATGFAVVQLTVYLVYFLAAIHFLNSAARLRAMVYTVLAFCSVAAFFGILQFLAKPDAIYGLRPTPWAEPFGPYVNRHHFAALMVMSFATGFAVFLGHHSAREKKMLLLISMVLAGISVVLTGSRGGVLSIVAAALFVIVASVVSAKASDSEEAGSRSTKIISSGLALFTLIALVVGSVLLLGGDSSLVRGLGVVQSEDFSTGRIHFWKVTWDVIRENPMTGVGLDSLAVAFTKFDTWSGTVRVEQSHNDYLQILAEAGIFGLLAVVTFVVVVFRKGLRNIAQSESGFSRGMTIGALGGLLGVLIHSFFDFPLRTPSNGFFFILLAVFATTDVRFHVRHHDKRRKRRKLGWSSVITPPGN